MITAFVVLLVVISSGASATEHVASQTDWCGGGGVAGPVTGWGAAFDVADGLSWLQWPGRLVLAAHPRTEPVEHPLTDGSSGAIKILPADVDLDGDTDLLGVSYWDDRIDLFLNTGGTPPSWNHQVIAEGFSRALAVAVADVDGDGRPDILGGADEAAEISWWRNEGGTPPSWTRHLIDDHVPGAHDVAGADIDRDGDLDVIAVSYQDDVIVWWRNEGGDPVSWSRFQIASGFDYPTKIDVADLDRDGDLDIVAVAWLDRQIAWWRNDGGDPIEWSRQPIASGFTGAHWVTADDIDRDGRIDVAGAAMDLGEVAWWRNQGGDPVTWIKLPVTGSLPGAVSVATADLDGDGDVDLAASGWHPSGGVGWWENVDGTGTGWHRHSVGPSFGESSSVAVADVDGNGTPDLLASSWSLDRYAWWDALELEPSGELIGSILDTGGTTDWSDCSWVGEQTPGSTIVVSARTGDSPGAMGPWREMPASGACQPLVDGTRYVQYRVQVELGTSTRSPTFHELSIGWSSAGIPAPRRVRTRLMP